MPGTGIPKRELIQPPSLYMKNGRIWSEVVCNGDAFNTLLTYERDTFLHYLHINFVQLASMIFPMAFQVSARPETKKVYQPFLRRYKNYPRVLL